jgi:DNA-binding response OmpR family regulator
MSKKILMIDDEQGILTIFSHRLRFNGYEVMDALSGAEGIEKAKLWRPDLILLDIMMPEMDGYQVLENLKRQNDLKAIPVFITSVKFQREDIRKAIGLGAVDYIVKPFETNVLLEKIKAVLP